MLRAILAASLLLLAGCAQRTAARRRGRSRSRWWATCPTAPPPSHASSGCCSRSATSRRSAFVLHAGDLKGSDEPCSDALLRRRLEQLQVVRTASSTRRVTTTGPIAIGAGRRRLPAARATGRAAPFRLSGSRPFDGAGAPCVAVAGRLSRERAVHPRRCGVRHAARDRQQTMPSEPWRAPPARRAPPCASSDWPRSGSREDANIAWLEAAFARRAPTVRSAWSS